MHELYRVEQVIVSEWWDPVTVADVDRVHAETTKLMSYTNQKMTLLAIIRDGTKAPSEEVREAMDRSFQGVISKVSGVYYVIEVRANLIKARLFTAITTVFMNFKLRAAGRQGVTTSVIEALQKAQTTDTSIDPMRVALLISERREKAIPRRTSVFT